MRRDIIYLHGLGSSPQSAKAHLVRSQVCSVSDLFIAPILNVPTFEGLSPNAALSIVRRTIQGVIDAECVVVASSFGAYLALHALGQLIERGGSTCEKVVLLAPAIDPWDPRSNLLTPDAEARWRGEGSFPLMYFPENQFVRVGSQFVEELAALGPAPTVHGISTLLVHGTRDKVVHYAQSESYANRNDDAVLSLMDDDHGLMSDPSLLASIITTFLATRT